MPYTKDDVGGVPGKPPLSDADKQAIADEWNANEAEAAARTPEPTLADKVAALFEKAPKATRDLAQRKADDRQAGRGG